MAISLILQLVSSARSGKVGNPVKIQINKAQTSEPKQIKTKFLLQSFQGITRFINLSSKISMLYTWIYPLSDKGMDVLSIGVDVLSIDSGLITYTMIKYVTVYIKILY